MYTGKRQLKNGNWRKTNGYGYGHEHDMGTRKSQLKNGVHGDS